MLKNLKKYIFISLGALLVLYGADRYWLIKESLKEVESKQLQEEVIEVEDVPESAVPFTYDLLIQKAKDLANEGYKEPEKRLPEELKALSYDEYRDIRFNRKSGVWFGKSLPFELQFFHLGSIFQTSVPINEVRNNKSAPIKYSPDFFDYGKNKLSVTDENIGYAGFRLHGPINTWNYYDEIITFLGASYFRAISKGQKYGLSARGLAIDTAEPTGEEFPIFKEFWIERPNLKSTSIKVYALLDSPSITGAYKFIVTSANFNPKKSTTVEVEAKLFPRTKINKLGIAPLTSMFLFGENTKNRFDDYRPEVHDSEGMLIHNGKGEWIWRPLDNSKYLRISSFVDENPKGFGLMQRDRDPEHYQDFEANYELRPSVWVEPVGDWGAGMVQLVEIPTVSEIHDNIVSYWVPDKEVKPGDSLTIKYILHWCDSIPQKDVVAKVASTFTGIGGVSGLLAKEKRKFVINFEGNISEKEITDGIIKPNVFMSDGKVLETHLAYNPLLKGATVYLDFIPASKISEIRVSLTKDEKIISEIWSYQWLP